MTNQYVGGGPSRMSLLVAVLLAVALMAALLALALAMGILQFRQPGGGGAVISPTPGRPASLPPATADPTVAAPGATPASTEPTVTAQPAPTAQASPGGVHVVQAGESLSSIGLLYGVPWGEIAAANDITDPNLLQVGQELSIPVPSSASLPPGVHVVQTGESISSIAELYNVSPTDLAEANQLENWDLIYVGQQLVIPGLGPDGASPSPAP